MSQEEFWVLCISLGTPPKVKIGGSEDVVAKDEKLVVLGFFDDKDHAEWVRQSCGDERIIENWKAGLCIDYSEMFPWR